MNKRNIIIAVVIIIVGGLWYAFRPELIFVNKTVSEEFPGGAAMASIEKGPMAVTTGNFKGLAHETKGLASIYQLADGKRTLRLTEFETSNGPDVHVYLTAAEVAKGSDAIKAAGFIDLGSMKGNKGDQNYDLPAGAWTFPSTVPSPRGASTSASISPPLLFRQEKRKLTPGESTDAIE